MPQKRAKDTFDFKQFSIRQDRCAMKVGTDGVLLGAWAELPPVGYILDIGTGTGLVALMAAQRSEAQVVGIEIDAAAAGQATENAAVSPWKNRIKILCGDVTAHIFEEKFNCILSNPPFFEGTLLPPDAARCTARHASSLPFAVLARTAANLLTADGTFSVVLPVAEGVRFIDVCTAEMLYLCRRTTVLSTEAKPPRRLLLTFSRDPQPVRESQLILNAPDGSRHNTYKQLTADFYIK